MLSLALCAIGTSNVQLRVEFGIAHKIAYERPYAIPTNDHY